MRTIHKNLLTILLLAVIVLPYGCTRDVHSAAHRNIDEAGWAVQDTIVLPFTVEDTTLTYSLALTLRHTELYPYQNIWFFVSPRDSVTPLHADTVPAILADDRGCWLTTRTGRYYTGYVMMAHSLHFSESGTYSLAIVHGMRDSLLCGIADVGIELRTDDTHGAQR